MFNPIAVPRGRTKSLVPDVCTKCHRIVTLTENLEDRTISPEKCPCCNDKHYNDLIDEYLNRLLKDEYENQLDEED